MSAGCPSWCTTPADVHEQGDPFHDGPTLHGMAVSRLADGPVVANLQVDGEMSPSALRQLAADCLAVAAWIEDQS